jgi:hypothetical protein
MHKMGQLSLKGIDDFVSDDNLLIIADPSRTRHTSADVPQSLEIVWSASEGGEEWREVGLLREAVAYLCIHFLPKDQEAQEMRAMDIAAALGVVFLGPGETDRSSYVSSEPLVRKGCSLTGGGLLLRHLK